MSKNVAHVSYIGNRLYILPWGLVILQQIATSKLNSSDLQHMNLIIFRVKPLGSLNYVSSLSAILVARCMQSAIHTSMQKDHPMKGTN